MGFRKSTKKKKKAKKIRTPKELKIRKKKERLTWNIPRLTLVEVNFNQERRRITNRANLLHQIITDQFFISWMEPKSRRKFGLHHAYIILHFFFSSSLLQNKGERRREKEREKGRRLK